MASRLDIFNSALHYLGERKLSTLFEDREPRYVLDNIYSISLINEVHELVKPRYAIKTAALSSPTTSSVHGLDNVYTLPSDFLCPPIDPGTHGKVGFIWADDEFEQPINRYLLEGNTVATEQATNVYIRYVSSNIGEGSVSPLVARILAIRLAMLAASRINPSKQGDLNEQYEKLLAQVIAVEGVKENDWLPQPAAASLSTDQLEIYNLVMAYWGLPELRGIDDDSQYRLAIDNVYVRAEEYMFESIKPRFATQTAILNSGSTSSVHSLDNVFTLPADYKDFVSLWADEGLENKIEQYIIEDNTISIRNYATAYLRYITNAHAEANWSPSFSNAVAAYIAWLLSPRFAPERQESISASLSEATATAVENDKVREAEVRTQNISGALSASQLSLYNQIAARLGEPELRFVNDESELRLAIDNVYDLARDYLIEQIAPLFATKTSNLTINAGAIQGFAQSFALPADYSGLLGVWTDADMDEPVTRYFIEGGVIAVDNHASVYIRYSANAADEADWTPSFERAMADYIAYLLAPRFDPERHREHNQHYQDAIASAIAVDGGREPAVRPLPSTRSLPTKWRQLYNKALEVMKLPPLISDDDESERRVAIDYALDNGAIETVLELINWNYTVKSVKLDADTGLDPEWGFDYVFAAPSDMTRLYSISPDERFLVPLENWWREGPYFYADTNEIYLKYLSTDANDKPDEWPRYLYNLVAAEIARACCWLPGVNEQTVEKKYQEYKYEAYNTDAQRQKPQLISSGSWNRSRYRYDTRDRRRP